MGIKDLLLALSILLGLTAGRVWLRRRFHKQKKGAQDALASTGEISLPANSRASYTIIAPEAGSGSPGKTDENAPIQVSVKAPPGASVRLTLEALPAGAPGYPKARWDGDGKLSRRARAALRAGRLSLPGLLFGCSLLVYLATRLAGLEDFPIYFFTDEAVQTVMASDFVRDGWRNHQQELLPTYFSNGPTFNLSSVSVYLQVIPYLLFGKSVFVTRAVSALVSALGAVWVALALRDVFKIPYWWSGALLLSITPAWFYHSRTAFETVEMTAFYAGFLYYYLLYRCRSPRYLYPALVLGALVFYTYSPGMLIMLATGLLLLASDARYHWQNRKTALGGLALLLLLALPYLRYYLAHQTSAIEQLATRAPYWVQPIPAVEKLGRFASAYLMGLNPFYWYLPNDHDLPRHLMKGYGHLLKATFPFAGLGLWLALRNRRDPAYRATLAAALASPAGGALVGIGITRMLAFVIPVTLLTALGISRALEWLENPRRAKGDILPERQTDNRDENPPSGRLTLPGWKLPRQGLAVGLFAMLSVANLGMLRDGLTNGPTWYQDYGLGGMQYGARQVFAAVLEYLERSPETNIILTPTWANGTDVLARFFLAEPLPIRMGSVTGHMNHKLPLDDHTLFIMTPEEYEQACASGKFERVQVEHSLPYPNGQPGFYFARLSYAADIDQVLEAERELRRRLQESLEAIGGELARVRYSYLDMGEIGLLFDGDPRTVARTFEANPFVVEISFPRPRPLTGIQIIVGSIQAEINVRAYDSERTEIGSFSIMQKGTVEQPQVGLDFGETVLAWALNIEVRDMHQSEPGHVHIWEVGFKEVDG